MVRSFARRALPIVAGAFIACLFLQVFLAGLGVFDDPRSFITHRDFGYLLGWFTLVMLVLALVGRQRRLDRRPERAHARAVHAPVGVRRAPRGLPVARGAAPASTGS